MIEKYKSKVVWMVVLLLIAVSCNRQERPLMIAVSQIYGEPENNSYLKWLGYAAPDAELVVLYGMPVDSVKMLMKRSHGLLLTGGEDVYPGRYGREYDTVRCGAFDLYRDTLEFMLIDLATKRKMPVLGICRGQQILNVAMGGSLYIDIPTDLKTNIHHRCSDWQNCTHQVTVFPGSMLHNISQLEKGPVNSNHHQSVDKLADGLRVMAVAADGVIESIGRADTIGEPFLLGVQWHPERMDTTNNLSLPLAKRFIEEAVKFKN
jgi:gamma-glutamyl-gamma-aminobutyrate hydrolase PuuD